MKNNRRLIEKDDLLNCLIFFLLVLVIVFPIMHTGKIMANSDWLFHASRVEELFNNIKQGSLLTFISTKTFNHTGVGSFLFYPYLFIYPWALMRIIFSPIVAFYLWYGLMLFIAFLAAYFSMMSFSKNRYQSFAFSIIYVLSAYRLYLGMWTLGEFIGTSFLPIVFLGFYKVFFTPKGSEIESSIVLGIGMTLIIYSHVLSVIITIEIFILILVVGLLIEPKKLLKKFRPLLYSILITFVLTLPIAYIFLTNYFGNNISSTSSGIQLDQLSTFSNILKNSFDNVAGSGVGFTLIVTALIGWYFIRNKKTYVYIYLLGVLLLIVSSSMFPWYLISRSPFGIIQLPYRYLSYSSLFLSIVASRIICIFVNHIGHNVKIWFWIVMCILGITSFYSSLETMVSYVKNSQPTILSSKIINEKLPFTILNKANYSRQFNYLIPWGETDYYPSMSFDGDKAKSIVNQIAYINNKQQKIKENYFPNSVMYSIEIKKNSNIDLPVIDYYGTYTKIKGKLVKHETSGRGTVYFNKKQVPAGKVRIQVGYNPGIMYYICLIVSSLSGIALIIYYFKYKYV